MQLTWYGHASFRIESSDGKTIITDPYDPDTSGYKSFTEPADLVVISSATDSFHCNAHLIPGAPTIIALSYTHLRAHETREEHRCPHLL